MTPGLTLVADLWSTSAGIFSLSPMTFLSDTQISQSHFSCLRTPGSDYLAQTVEASKPNDSPGGICICLAYYRQKCVRVPFLFILEHPRIPKMACWVAQSPSTTRNDQDGCYSHHQAEARGQ